MVEERKMHEKRGKGELKKEGKGALKVFSPCKRNGEGCRRTAGEGIGEGGEKKNLAQKSRKELPPRDVSIVFSTSEGGDKLEKRSFSSKKEERKSIQILYLKRGLPIQAFQKEKRTFFSPPGKKIAIIRFPLDKKGDGCPWFLRWREEKE